MLMTTIKLRNFFERNNNNHSRKDFERSNNKLTMWLSSRTKPKKSKHQPRTAGGKFGGKSGNDVSAKSFETTKTTNDVNLQLPMVYKKETTNDNEQPMFGDTFCTKAHSDGGPRLRTSGGLSVWNENLSTGTSTKIKYSIKESQKLTTKDGHAGRRITMSVDNDNDITKEWNLASAPTNCDNSSFTGRYRTRFSGGTGSSFSRSSSSNYDLEAENMDDESSVDSYSTKNTIDSNESADLEENVATESLNNGNESESCHNDDIDNQTLNNEDIELDRNILVNYHELKNTLEKYLCCKFCSGKGRKYTESISVGERTTGIATTLTIDCPSCSKTRIIVPSKTIVSTNKKKESAIPSLKQFAIHYSLILCSMTNGFGLSALGNILACLGLRCPSLIGRVHRSAWRELEKETGTIVRMVTKNIVENNLQEEAEATIRVIDSQKKNPIIGGASIADLDPVHGVPLTVSCDSAWQKRSSGNRFDSLSSHCLMIGQHTKLVIGYDVFCKQCKVCTKREAKKKSLSEGAELVEQTLLDNTKTTQLQDMEDMLLLKETDNNKDDSQNLLEEVDEMETSVTNQVSQTQDATYVHALIETQVTNVSELTALDDDSIVGCVNNEEINDLLHNNITSNCVSQCIDVTKRGNKIPKYDDKDYKMKEIIEWVPTHPGCCRNYEGTSKSMEVVGNTLLVWRIYNHKGKHNCYVHALVTDDDTTTRAAMRHSFNDQLKNGDWKIEDKKTMWPKYASGKGYLPDLGRLPLNMKTPEDFLADPSHRKKTYGNQFYKLAACNNNDIQKCDAEVLKIYFGYAQTLYNGEDEVSFGNRFKACLEHLHNVHDYCDSSWCKFKDNPEAIASVGVHKYRQYGTKDYEKLKEVHDHYTSTNMLRMINHKWSTQKNESLNRCIAKCAPKHLHYSNSLNLHSRIAFAIGSNSVGYVKFINLLHNELKMKLNNVSLTAWNKMEEDRLYFKEYKSRPTTKARRIKKYREKLKKALEETRIARQLKLDYESGVAVKMKAKVVKTKPVVAKAKKTLPKVKNIKIPTKEMMVCPQCKQTTHPTSNYPECPFYINYK